MGEPGRVWTRSPKQKPLHAEGRERQELAAICGMSGMLAAGHRHPMPRRSPKWLRPERSRTSQAPPVSAVPYDVHYPTMTSRSTKLLRPKPDGGSEARGSPSTTDRGLSSTRNLARSSPTMAAAAWRAWLSRGVRCTGS